MKTDLSVFTSPRGVVYIPIYQVYVSDSVDGDSYVLYSFFDRDKAERRRKSLESSYRSVYILEEMVFL